MKKRFVITRFFCVLLCITMLAVPLSIFAAGRITNSVDVLQRIRLRQELGHCDVTLAYIERFGYSFTMNYFRSIEIINDLYATFEMNSDGRMVYPDYFGGVYINDDGMMVLLMVEGASSQVDDHILRAQRSSGVLVREVPFSLAELRAAMGFLGDFIPHNLDNPVAANATSWGLSVSGNYVHVDLIEYNEEQVALFRRLVLDAPMLRFQLPQVHFGWTPEDMEAHMNPTLQYIDNDELDLLSIGPLVRPGQWIRASRNGQFLSDGTSLSFRAQSRSTGVRGFVMTGHDGFQRMNM